MAQVNTLQDKCTASDTHTAQLQHQLSTLEANQALLGGRLHDGSLDHITGQLIQDLQQQLMTSSAVTAAATAASQQSAAQLQKLEEQLAVQQQAQAAERERLSMEAAQSRLLCKARARQVSTLEAQSKAQVRSSACLVQILRSKLQDSHTDLECAVKHNLCNSTLKSAIHAGDLACNSNPGTRCTQRPA